MSVFHLSGRELSSGRGGGPNSAQRKSARTSLKTAGREVLFPPTLLIGGPQAGAAGGLTAFACVGPGSEKKEAGAL